MKSKFRKFSPISTGSWVPENVKEKGTNDENTYTILVNKLILNALIGIHDHEKSKKQKICITLNLKANDNFNNLYDNIDNVVSYEHIVNDIKEFIGKGHVGLLETLAEEIVIICFKDKRILEAKITIEKLEVFSETHSVGIEIQRKRKKKYSK
tara:strand:- start:2526 stop:2984 length:459 start_codon:yes stop_codon:yes gene_type:complete